MKNDHRLGWPPALHDRHVRWVGPSYNERYAMGYRLSKVDVLKFALEGAVTRRGVQLGNMDEEEEEDLDKDIAELEKRLAKAKESQ